MIVYLKLDRVKQFNKEEVLFSISDAGTTVYLHEKYYEVRPLCTSCAKMYSK